MSEAQKLKDKAVEAFARGKFAKSAQLYADFCKADPRDLQARLRMGDAWARANEPGKAIAAYQSAAESFARQGLLPRAIAASKLILEIDPSHQQIQRLLAQLYARKEEGKKDLPPFKSAHPGASVSLDEEEGTDSQGGLETNGLIERNSGWNTAAHASPVSQGREIDFEAEDVSKPVAPPATAPRSRQQTALNPDAPDSGQTSSQDLDLSAELPPELQVAPPADSLLHAVERAAEAGIVQRSVSGSVTSTNSEEAIDSGEDLGSDRSVLSALPKIPLFSDLPPDAFIALFERCPMRTLDKDERLLEQGTVGDAFYVICEGSVRVLRSDSTGERPLGTLGVGAFFGEMAILSGVPRSASIVSSAEQTRVLEISAQVLAELSSRFPQVFQALRKFCRQRMLSNMMGTSMLFKPLTASERKDLVQRFRTREARAGELIIRQGERSEGLYVVLSGAVAVHKNGQELATLKEGELFGEISLLHKTPATASVTATRRTTLMRLPPEAFDPLISAYPQVLDLVADLTTDRLKQAEVTLKPSGELELAIEEMI